MSDDALNEIINEAIVSAGIEKEAGTNTFELLKKSAMGFDSREEWLESIKPYEQDWLRDNINHEDLYITKGKRKGQMRMSLLPNKYQSPKSNISKLFDLGKTGVDMADMSRKDMQETIKAHKEPANPLDVLNKDLKRLIKDIRQTSDAVASAENVITIIQAEFNL